MAHMLHVPNFSDGLERSNIREYVVNATGLVFFKKTRVQERERKRRVLEFYYSEETVH